MANMDEKSNNSRLTRLWNTFKNEFRLENFSLSFEKNTEFMKKDPEEVLQYFHSPIWPCFNGSIVYVVYRIFIAIYYTIWFIESIVRNYEFRAQNFHIANKKKINILLLHPWPFYMTSWSLTILFIHLWISAFIVLYFYSINQKSILNRFFTFLFGPFSCSRKNRRSRIQIIRTSLTQQQQPERNFSDQVNNESPCILTRIKNSIFKKQNSNTRKCNRSDLNEPNELDLLNSTQNKLIKTSTIDQESLKPFTIEQEIRSQSNKLTYCDNKLNCYLPSSSVTSDSASWKLWIDTHVPGVILVLIKISWLLYNQIVISAIVVTIGYFTYVTIMEIESEPTWIAEIGNLHRHGVNSIVAIIDIVLLAYPVRILHFIYTSLYGWLYALVTFIYWLQNPKENIVYNEIDYNKPILILGYYVLLTVLTFVMQIFHFFAYQFKLFLKEKYIQVRKNCFSANSN